jgi:hypothetical protein
VAGSLVSGAMGFVPGLHVALAVCGGAFLLGAVVTAATVDRGGPHHWPPGGGPTSATQLATREAG